MGFGKATLGGNSSAFWTVKAGDRGETGHNFFRVLPSYGKLERAGHWSIFFGQHFGFSGQGQGDKPRARPFKCIREVDRKTEMTIVECPECVNREGMIAKRDALKAQLVTEGRDEATIKSALKEYNEWLKSHNLDKSFYVAAMNQKGEFGVLKLKYEAFKDLETKVKKLLQEDGVHALLLDQGVWFDFQRTGEYLDTKYVVDPVYETIAGENGRKYKELKLAPISNEDADRALAVLPELVDLPTVLTLEQIERLVACSGDPAEVDAIMGVSQKQGTQAKAAQTYVPPPAAAAPAAHVGSPAPQAIRQAAPAAQTVSPAQTQAPTAQVVEEDEESRLTRMLEEARAKKAARATPAPAAAPTAVQSSPTPTAAAAPSGEMDFLKKYGFGGASTATK